MITVLQWSRGADWMLEFMALCKIIISDSTLRFVLQVNGKNVGQLLNSYYGNVVESSVEIERLANKKGRSEDDSL
jgi:hypothetical protein